MQKTKKIPTNDILKACQDLFYADIVVRTEIGIRTLVDRKQGYVPAQTLSMKTDEADLKVV